MVTASSQVALRQALVGIGADIQANELSDLTEEEGELSFLPQSTFGVTDRFSTQSSTRSSAATERISVRTSQFVHA